MRSLVNRQVVELTERSLADVARVWTFAGVASYVAPHHLQTDVLFVARHTHVAASLLVVSYQRLQVHVLRGDGGSTSASVCSFASSSLFFHRLLSVAPCIQ